MAQERCTLPATMLSFDQFVQWVNHHSYKLDLSGVVGLLGGSNAVEALGTIHLYAGRRWAGWYNYPGTVAVAQRYGQMADSRLWDILFPAPDRSASVIFNLAGKPGPGYSGAISGTKLQRTGHLGYLIAQECARCPGEELHLTNRLGGEGRKTGSSTTVTVISLPPQRHEKTLRGQANTRNNSATKQEPAYIPIHPNSDHSLALWAIVPSLVSILVCVFCILARDFYCASLILLGIFSSGISSLVLGTATLKIRVPVPTKASPPGDGLLFPEDGSIIVLKGQEADVNIITKGEFELDYSNGILPHRSHIIGACSLLLLMQFLVQLFFVPLCTLFGQILFLLSFVTSAVYHLYVVSHEKEKVQRELLLQELAPRIDKRIVGCRTQIAVFVCSVLGDTSHRLRTKSEETLKHILPNDTPVWRYWRVKVLKELALFGQQGLSSSYEPSIKAEPVDQIESKEYESFTDDEKALLNILIEDAWCIFREYPMWREHFHIGREQVREEKSYLLSAICFA